MRRISGANGIALGDVISLSDFPRDGLATIYGEGNAIVITPYSPGDEENPDYVVRQLAALTRIYLPRKIVRQTGLSGAVNVTKNEDGGVTISPLSTIRPNIKE